MLCLTACLQCIHMHIDGMTETRKRICVYIRLYTFISYVLSASDPLTLEHTISLFLHFQRVNHVHE
jgi:hypothetical protein